MRRTVIATCCALDQGATSSVAYSRRRSKKAKLYAVIGKGAMKGERRAAALLPTPAPRPHRTTCAIRRPQRRQVSVRLPSCRLLADALRFDPRRDMGRPGVYAKPRTSSTFVALPIVRRIEIHGDRGARKFLRERKRMLANPVCSRDGRVSKRAQGTSGNKGGMDGATSTRGGRAGSMKTGKLPIVVALAAHRAAQAESLKRRGRDSSHSLVIA